MSHATTEKTIAQMTVEIRQVNIEKGWRAPDGGPASNSIGDYLALLHSELSEALEAYRDHRLADATKRPKAMWAAHELGKPAVFQGYDTPKPEGVGSEFADLLIRLLDMCDVIAVNPADDMDRPLN